MARAQGCSFQTPIHRGKPGGVVSRPSKWRCPIRNQKSQIRNLKSRGFTLVELLVVITIIGILIALLLPAVQAAREAARRMQCSNNVKQIGLALHNYESITKALPPGAIWYHPLPRNGSILLHILPFIEQQSLYDAFDFKQASLDGQFFEGSSEEIGSTIVSTYVCPSDNHPGVIDIETHMSHDPVNRVALHNYTASRGPASLSNNGSCACTHNWNSYAMAGYGASKFPGPFTRVSTCVKFAEITDGLSNTIFFGEIRPMCSWHGDNGWATSNNGNGYCSTVIPINYDSCSRDSATSDGCARYCNWNTEAGFRSSHPGGAHFLFGDGSVHFLPETIDHQTYQYLGAKADGNVVDYVF